MYEGEEFIEFGPERTRGEELARFSRGRGSGFMTPNERAAWNLNKALEQYNDYDLEARNGLQELFLDMEQLRTMNMPTLAVVLNFMRSLGINLFEDDPVREIGSKISPAVFETKNIKPYIDPLLTKKQLNNHEANLIKYKAQFLMYIRTILKYFEEYLIILYYCI